MYKKNYVQNFQFFQIFILELSNSDKKNQSNSGAIDVNIKKLEKTDENSNENAKQKIVLKEIQNQMSDKLQGLYKILRLFIILVL